MPLVENPELSAWVIISLNNIMLNFISMGYVDEIKHWTGEIY